MEGDICDLPGIIALKRKYKFYLYVDEAHSIGALGPTGRGVCEHWGVNPSDVEILMGTFTKSFGSAGGYIASSREMVAHLRMNAYSSVYAEAVAPALCQQIISALTIVMGEDGTDEGTPNCFFFIFLFILMSELNRSATHCSAGQQQRLHASRVEKAGFCDLR